MTAQVGKQGRLANAGHADETDVAVAVGRDCVCQQFLKQRLATAEHIAIASFLDERLHRSVFLGELVGLGHRVLQEMIPQFQI